MREPVIAEGVEYIRSHDRRTPAIGLILGSGLGGLVEAVGDRTEISTQTIPGFPGSTVEGHVGRLVIGTLENRTVLILQGRIHRYEGYSIREVTFPVRLLDALGVNDLIITNAAGGINPNFLPGSLMFIDNHITLGTIEISVGVSGKSVPGTGEEIYDPEWRLKAQKAALDVKLQTERGVYLWTHGPSYETPAEIRAFGLLGADAVGMSTVPEALQAHALGMKVLGISMITNRAAGLHSGSLTHEEVLQSASDMRDDLTHLVRRIIGFNRV